MRPHRLLAPIVGFILVARAGDLYARDGEEPLILMIAEMAGSDSLAVAWGILLLAGAAMGILFALLFGPRVRSLRGGLGYGVLYGLVWWLLGPLVLMPVLLGMSPFSPLTDPVMRFSALVGLVGFVLGGLVLGGIYVALSGRAPRGDAAV